MKRFWEICMFCTIVLAVLFGWEAMDTSLCAIHLVMLVACFIGWLLSHDDDSKRATNRK